MATRVRNWFAVVEMSGNRADVAVGTPVFVRDDESIWIKAEVTEVKDGKVVVKTDQEDIKELDEKAAILLRNPDEFDDNGLVTLDDLTQLVHLHEASLLESLHNRFDTDKIYTFTGPILIAINPFKMIPGLYSTETMSEFMTTERSKVPHVFATANAAYRGLLDNRTPQTVLISGESGAGKTETTKFVMKFLASAGLEQEAGMELDSPATHSVSIEQKVLQSNPLLEAFGNARTLRNDNSSRFGKFIELQFKMDKNSRNETTGRVCGAKVETYLLEKVRVCDQQEGERSYHIFYQLCAAAAQANAESDGQFAIDSELSLDLSQYEGHHSFRYLTKSSCYELEGVDDVDMLRQTVKAMKTVGVSVEEVKNIIKVVGGVLYLGNTVFEKDPSNSEGAIVAEHSLSQLQTAGQLIGVDPEVLADVLTHRTIKTVGEEYRRALTIEQADDCRDALARALFGTLFLTVARRINESLSHEALSGGQPITVDPNLRCGVLDIFGFECFDFNSFEQLCINFTNERLQQHFNTFIFKVEEAIYKDEGIPWNPLDFPDNQDCVDLLQEKPFGVFSMLDEECVVPQGSDKSFASKLGRQHAKHARFAPVKTKPTWFAIQHFAGPVQYCSDNFLEKNRDQLLPDVQTAVSKSSNDFVEFLFTEMLDRKAAGATPSNVPAKKKNVTVSLEFREQLNSLMTTVGVTEPHFIRCIKPNPQNQPDDFDRPSVNEQLRYGGVLQAVQVSRAGYPIRVNHEECWSTYSVLLRLPKFVNDQKISSNAEYKRLFALLPAKGVPQTLPAEESKTRAAALMTFLDTHLPIPRPPKRVETEEDVQPWAVGKNLCFFKQEAYEALASHRMSLRASAAARIQAQWKGFTARREYLATKAKIVRAQAFVRGKLARLQLRKLRQAKAIVAIQRVARGFLVRARMQKDKKCIVQLQSVVRTFLARKAYGPLRENTYAARIQAVWKGRKERAYFLKLKAGVTTAQLKWRSIRARRQLRRLKQEQKEAGALLAKVQNLTEEVSTLKKAAADDEARRYREQREAQHKQEVIAKLEQEVAKLSSSAATIDTLQKRVQELESLLAAANAATSEANARATKAESELQEQQALLPELQGALGNFEATLQTKEAEIRSLQQQVADQKATQKETEMELARFKQIAQSAATGTAAPLMHPSATTTSQGVASEHKEVMTEIHSVITAASVPELTARPQGESPSARAPMPPAPTSGSAGSSNVMGSLVSALKNLMPNAKQESASTAAANPSTAIQLLKPSLLASTDLQNEYKTQIQTGVVETGRRRLDAWHDVRAIQELQENDSAVTCVVFGQEKEHLYYSLLACASKDGGITIYRVYRTEAELNAMKPSERARLEEKQRSDNNPFDRPPKSDYQLVNVHARLTGHSRAVTSIFFSLMEDQLISTSIDKTVRFWNVETGEMLKVFTDSSPALVAAFLPFNPQVFVAANSNKVVRLVHVTQGAVIQKLKIESEIRTLRFDDTGMYCLAGCKNGSIQVFEAVDSQTLRFKFKSQLAQGALTCITFVPAADESTPPCLYVNACDSTVAIVDCIYGPPGVLSQLRVRHRVKVAHSLLPLRCCHSAFGGGFLVTASEDKEVYVYSMETGANYKMHYLKHHQAPVLSVACNHLDTTIVSADSLGHIIFWRRLDYTGRASQPAIANAPQF